MAHHAVITMSTATAKAKVEVVWDADYANPDFTVECENNYIARSVALVAAENFADAYRVAYCMNKFYREGNTFHLD